MGSLWSSWNCILRQQCALLDSLYDSLGLANSQRWLHWFCSRTLLCLYQILPVSPVSLPFQHFFIGHVAFFYTIFRFLGSSSILIESSCLSSFSGLALGCRSVLKKIITNALNYLNSIISDFFSLVD